MTSSQPVHTTETPVSTDPDDADLRDCPLVTSDGKPILVVERGLAPHPHPSKEGKLVPYRFLQRIQLADETILYRCARFLDGDSGPRCWRDDFTNPRSAASHISAHNQGREPLYPEETLRTIVRLVRTFKEAGKRNYAQLAAEELNRRGVPTQRAERWTKESVSSLFNQYRDTFRTYVRQSELLRLNPDLAPVTRVAAGNTGAPAPAPAPRPAPAPDQEILVSESVPAPIRPLATTGDASLAALDHTSAKLLREATSLFDLHRSFAADLAQFVETVGAKVTELAAQATARGELDEETRDAARRWHEMKRLMAGPTG